MGTLASHLTLGFLALILWLLVSPLSEGFIIRISITTDGILFFTHTPGLLAGIPELALQGIECWLAFW